MDYCPNCGYSEKTYYVLGRLNDLDSINLCTRISSNLYKVINGDYEIQSRRRPLWSGKLPDPSKDIWYNMEVIKLQIRHNSGRVNHGS